MSTIAYQWCASPLYHLLNENCSVNTICLGVNLRLDDVKWKQVSQMRNITCLQARPLRLPALIVMHCQEEVGLYQFNDLKDDYGVREELGGNWTQVENVGQVHSVLKNIIVILYPPRWGRNSTRFCCFVLHAKKTRPPLHNFCCCWQYILYYSPSTWTT